MRQRPDGTCGQAGCSYYRKAATGAWLKKAKLRMSPLKKQPTAAVLPAPATEPVEKLPLKPPEALPPKLSQSLQPQPSHDMFLSDGSAFNVKIMRAHLLDPKRFHEVTLMLGLSAAHGVLSCMHGFLDSCPQTPVGKLADVSAVLLSIAISLVAPDFVSGIRGNNASWRERCRKAVGNQKEFQRIEAEWLCLLPCSQQASAAMVRENCKDARLED
jgi:hypothetical protein